jgi:hypothetical protein
MNLPDVAFIQAADCLSKESMNDVVELKYVTISAL